MKRRNFIQSLAALISAPALPATALIQSTAASTASQTLLTPNLYTWSKTLARRSGKLSPDMIASSLNIEMSKASEIFGRLVSNGILGPTNTLGVAQTRPLTKVNLPKDLTETLSKNMADEEQTEDSTVPADQDAQDKDDDGLCQGCDDIV